MMVILAMTCKSMQFKGCVRIHVIVSLIDRAPDHGILACIYSFVKIPVILKNGIIYARHAVGSSPPCIAGFNAASTFVINS